MPHWLDLALGIFFGNYVMPILLYLGVMAIVGVGAGIVYLYSEFAEHHKKVKQYRELAERRVIHQIESDRDKVAR
jgi:hypothetical protein